MVRTRLYLDGGMQEENFPLDQVSEKLRVKGSTVWIDLEPTDDAGLHTMADELGLHAVAVREALDARPRTTFVRYPGHEFLTTQALHLDSRGGLTAHPISMFVTERAVVTFRSAGFDIESVQRRWDAECQLCHHGSGFLLHGLLDYVVQTQYESIFRLGEELEEVEERLFDGDPRNDNVQREFHRLRRNLVRVRRLAGPTRDAVETLTDVAEHLVSHEMEPYFRNVGDRARRAAEYVDSLRDVVITIGQTQVALHDSRMNVITKKVSGWAALAVVPALVTGFYGMNVPFPGTGRMWGFIVSAVIMVVACGGLYWLMKRKDWL